jgi:hypothetical protein
MESMLTDIANGIRLLSIEGVDRRNMVIVVNLLGMKNLVSAMNGDSCGAVVSVSRVFDIPVEVDMLVEADDGFMVCDRRKYLQGREIRNGE